MNPMPNESIVWLHLSDWHQRGPEFDRSVVRDALIKDLNRRRELSDALESIDFVVFSGDLVFSGKSYEFDAASREFLAPVLEAARVPKDRVFLVPGNHDLDRGSLDLLPPLLKTLKDRTTVSQWLTTAARRQALMQPMREYAEFIERLLGSHAPVEPAYGYWKVLNIRGTRVAIVGMNSAWMCGQHVEDGEVHDYGHLILGEPQFYEPLQVSDVKAADLRIAVVHHPYSWLSDVVQRSHVEASLRQAFHFVLRGHEHDAHVEVPAGTSGDCAIISAGAAYDRRDYPNGYNFVHLNLKDKRGAVYLRRYDIQRGFHKDTTVTGDASPGYYQFQIPKSPSLSPETTTKAESKNDTTVRAIYDCRDPDIRAALELYEKRIPEHERFEAPDIVRWLREEQEERERGIDDARSYFIVAKDGVRVRGFALLHYHPKVHLAFIAYLVAAKGPKLDDEYISQKLLEKIKWLFGNEEYLASCCGFLLEVDDPAVARTAKHKQERLARIRLFCMLAESLGFSLRALDFDYRQPLLWIPAEDECGQEVPMMLMYARGSGLSDCTLGRSEVKSLLQFVYKWLYPEGFSEVENENIQYREYTNRLYDQQIQRIPEKVGLSNFRTIRARAKVDPTKQL
jgi:predicted phosphodiesterase